VVCVPVPCLHNDLMTTITAHPPAAVLWDMDGTLADTEPYWVDAEYQLVKDHGGTWSDEHADALVGNPLEVSAHYIRQHAGIDLPVPQIVQGLLLNVVDRLREEIPWMPGARELLELLRTSGIPCALVTMSYRSLTDPVVSALPPGSFAAVVSGEEVVRGKPDPEPYLTAAARLGVDPTACVAIEDSHPGTASALAAGARVLGVQRRLPLSAAPGLTVVSSLTGLGPQDLQALLPPCPA
jgi:HAD superfamily hydrolase (TIGR01509 family)